MKKYYVNYEDHKYEDWKEFDNEDEAWSFYAQMNEESGCWAGEPELEDLPS